MNLASGISASHLQKMPTPWQLEEWKEKIRETHMDLKHNLDVHKGVKFVESGGNAIGNEVSSLLGLASSPYETNTVSQSVRQSLKVLILPTIRFF